MKNLNHNRKTTGRYLSMLTGSIIMLSIISFAQTAQSQTSYKVTDGSRITVNGTSNIHDWTMTASSFSSEASLDFNGQQLQDVSALSFSLPVTNLKSKEDLMDTRAYKALKSSQYTRITFKLTEATVLSSQKIIKATGNLTIAGNTNQITIQSNYTMNGDEIIFKGSKSIKMSDYGIKAPSFMLGALKTGNDLAIDISLKLKKSNSSAITKN